MDSPAQDSKLATYTRAFLMRKSIKVGGCKSILQCSSQLRAMKRLHLQLREQCTEGKQSLLQGVRYYRGGATTNSIVMRASSGTVRMIKTQHKWSKPSVSPYLPSHVLSSLSAAAHHACHHVWQHCDEDQLLWGLINFRTYI